MGRAPQVLVVDDTTPGRPLLIGDIVVGDSVEQAYAFDARARQAFSQIANDRAPVHGDDRFAMERGYSGQIIQGLCVSTRFSRLIGMHLPGEHAILERVDFKFRRPTFESQTLRFKAEVTRLMPALKVVRLALTVTSDVGIHVLGEAQCLLR